jgi:hypothetical protein
LEIPYLADNKDFLFNILLNGKDIIRISEEWKQSDIVIKNLNGF